MIVTRFSQLIRDYHRLGTGDVFIGQVPSSSLKSAMLTDLTERGVVLLPAATAQILNASKVAQAFETAGSGENRNFTVCHRRLPAHSA